MSPPLSALGAGELPFRDDTPAHCPSLAHPAPHPGYNPQDQGTTGANLRPPHDKHHALSRLDLKWVRARVGSGENVCRAACSLAMAGCSMRALAGSRPIASQSIRRVTAVSVSHLAQGGVTATVEFSPHLNLYPQTSATTTSVCGEQEAITCSVHAVCVQCACRKCAGSVHATWVHAECMPRGCVQRVCMRCRRTTRRARARQASPGPRARSRAQRWRRPLGRPRWSGRSSKRRHPAGPA